MKVQAHKRICHGFYRILAFTAIIWVTPATGQTKVVVIPLGGDAGPIEPFAPLAPDAPGISNYTINSKVVLDNTTGLEWEKNPASSESFVYWREAKSYCKNLSLDGKTDWRLPEIHELISIAFYNSSLAGINPFVFPNTDLDDSYWSATRAYTYADEAWVVNFFDGSIESSRVDGTYEAFPGDALQNTRCVRYG